MSDSTTSSMEDTLSADPLLETAQRRTGGQLLGGRYELLSLVGSGGMGSVYKARDLELDEVVALKLLTSQALSSEASLVRFRQEVKLARRVTHPNVARTFDIGEHAGERFLTMEFIDGESLANLLEREGAVSLDAALSVARQICAGVAVAHEAGVVHRDLKPDNVLLTRDGQRVVVTDFGIARATMDGAATPGTILGTPAYMAPEQVAASATIDARADVYALGEILYEMVAGERAWPGQSPILVAAARLYQPPPDIRSKRPEVPQAIGEILLRCLAREPEQRFASARELESALVSYQSSIVQNALPISSGGRVEKKLAVLGFHNLGDPADDFLAMGLTEDLVDTLSMSKGLRVRARGIVSAPDADPAAEGRRLCVDAVVTGSIRKQGDRVRVNARVIGVADGFQLWAQRFDRSINEALVLNDDVAHAVAQALSAKLEAPQREASASPRAAELYFRLRRELSNGWFNENVGALHDLFREALAGSWDDAALLSVCAIIATQQSFVRGSQSLPELDVEAAASRALELAPHLSEPWVAIGVVRFNKHDDPSGAVRALHRAIENAPSSALAIEFAGRYLLEAGALHEAVGLLERALWLDPTSPWARTDLLRAHALAGRWNDYDAVKNAASLARQVIQPLPAVRFTLWRSFADPAKPPFEPPAELPASFEGYKIAARQVAGQRALDEEGKTALLKFAEGGGATPRMRRIGAQLVAEIFSAGHCEELALELIGQAVDAGLLDILWMDRCPLLASVREDPRFLPLRARVAERAEAIVAAWREPTP
ncbi:MAG: protein kinase [Polyangiaceae bacterium]